MFMDEEAGGFEDYTDDESDDQLNNATMKMLAGVMLKDEVLAINISGATRYTNSLSRRGTKAKPKNSRNILNYHLSTG